MVNQEPKTTPNKLFIPPERVTREGPINLQLDQLERLIQSDETRVAISTRCRRDYVKLKPLVHPDASSNTQDEHNRQQMLVRNFWVGIKTELQSLPENDPRYTNTLTHYVINFAITNRVTPDSLIMAVRRNTDLEQRFYPEPKPNA